MAILTLLLGLALSIGIALAGTNIHRTPRWREVDSNPRSPGYGGTRRRLAARDATRVRNTIVRVDQLEREKAGRSHRLQAASTSSTSIDSPEHGVPGAVFGRYADLDSHPPLRAQSCDPAMVHQHLEPNFILVESASPR